MQLNSFFKINLVLACLALASCKTDDVQGEPTIDGPVVSLNANNSSINEDMGEAQITATLSESVASDVSLTISLAGTATDGVDYNISDVNLIIPTGSLSASVLVQAIQDTDEEGNEDITMSIGSVTGATAANAQPLTITIEDDDVALQLSIIVNEILYDPWNDGLNGDANGDGQYAQNEDEFIEFVNLSNQTVDFGGYKIFDSEALTSGTPRHVFPPNTWVAPNKAIVVFGGGTPTGTFGGATVQTSTTGDMNLNNAGDVMTLQDANGNVVVTFDIEPLSNNPNESYTRNPDLTGDFEQHGDNTGRLFSPGTKIDASPF